MGDEDAGKTANAKDWNSASPLSRAWSSPSTNQERDKDQHLRRKLSRTDVEEKPPPLPPRPANLDLLQASPQTPEGTLQRPKTSHRPQLQSTATTAVSLTDIHTLSHPNGPSDIHRHSANSTPSGQSLRGYGSAGKFRGLSGDIDETASVRSYAPTLEAGGDVESLLGDVLRAGQESPAWKLLSNQEEGLNPFDSVQNEEDEILRDFDSEFDDIGVTDPTGANEEELRSLWWSKRKHFIILSSAGKPIYNRHGDDNLISGSIGVIQTIISFYESTQDSLKGFTAGAARFVIVSKGPLYLVAISKLGENDSQLRVQLEALYMQILSTLTLPRLTSLFSNRPSTDLRRPLQGTETLLSGLADTFSRGSPSTLLSSLECLKIRKSQRQLINSSMLKAKCDDLLYGLIVAGGRLVSVVRPKRHSLHPGDLQLIFNMLFEAGSVKAGGGENWIPLCLPGFNKNGYLYMFVSFLDSHTHGKESIQMERESERREDEIAIILISANKESFYDLLNMRDAIIEDLEANGTMAVIKSAVRQGRPATTDIIPGTVLRHFLYKSRGNVQYVMPTYKPYYTTMIAKRKLISLYHTLHAAVHAKMSHLKVHHCVSHDSVSLAWITPLFELYCVAGPNASRNALAQSANKVIQWVRREEERVFIIGGAVF